jgi:hypothetical protein
VGSKLDRLCIYIYIYIYIGDRRLGNVMNLKEKESPKKRRQTEQHPRLKIVISYNVFSGGGTRKSFGLRAFLT